MKFLHCDINEKFFSLHDCIADHAEYDFGILSFSFRDGFWVFPDHPDSGLQQIVRSGSSKVEFITDDVTVYIFKRSLFRTVRKTVNVDKLVDMINYDDYKLEFLYQYVSEGRRIIECELISEKRPYRQECQILIFPSSVLHHWDCLRPSATY